MQFVGHTASIFSVAFSPDGHYALTGSADKTARLWEISTGKEVMRFVGHTTSIFSVAFSPDGHYILTGSGVDRAEKLAHQTLILLEEVRIQQELEQAKRAIEQAKQDSLDNQDNQDQSNKPAVLPSPKKTILPLDYSVSLWEVNSGQVRAQFKGHTDNVYSVAFSPDGRTILTCSGDKTVRLWDTSHGELLQFEGHTSGVYSAVFSSDGCNVLTSSADKTARLWEISSGQEVRKFEGHTSDVYR